MELGPGVHRGFLTTRMIVLFTREPFNIAFPTADSAGWTGQEILSSSEDPDLLLAVNPADYSVGNGGEAAGA